MYQKLLRNTDINKARIVQRVEDPSIGCLSLYFQIPLTNVKSVSVSCIGMFKIDLQKN